MDTLVARLQAITGSNPDAVLYVRGDKDINYGKVLEVMSLDQLRRVPQGVAGRRGAEGSAADAGAAAAGAQR